MTDRSVSQSDADPRAARQVMIFKGLALSHIFRHYVDGILDEVPPELSGERLVDDGYGLMFQGGPQPRSEIFPGGYYFPELLAVADAYSLFLFQRRTGIVFDAETELRHDTAYLTTSLAITVLGHAVGSIREFSPEAGRYVLNIDRLNIGDPDKSRCLYFRDGGAIHTAPTVLAPILRVDAIHVEYPHHEYPHHEFNKSRPSFAVAEGPVAESSIAEDPIAGAAIVRPGPDRFIQDSVGTSSKFSKE